MAAALDLRRRLDDPEALELPEPLCEDRAGESGSAVEDLAEGLTAQMHVADDNGVQRSAKISATRAIGQYWP